MVNQYEICTGYFKKELYCPFLRMALNCLKATESLQGGSLLFITEFPEFVGTSLIDLKDERLSQPWNHPVVLKMGPLDLESSALITRSCTRPCNTALHV